MKVFWIIIIALVLGSLRIYGVKHEAFQAVAHLYVGGLFGAWLVTKEKFYLWIFIILTVLETVCAVASRL